MQEMKTNLILICICIFITFNDAFVPVKESNGKCLNQKRCTSIPLFMGKHVNRARTEKNLDDMMGNDWKLFRAKLVAQEQLEQQEEESMKKSRYVVNKKILEYDDDHLGNQENLAHSFADIIASIFSSKENKESTKDNQSSFDGIDSIGSTGELVYECEDPFASEDEIVATTSISSLSVQLDSHRWAHPISHIEPGCVLVANEKLGGLFHQTVVLIVDNHASVGTTGIIINRPLPHNLLKTASETNSNVDLSLKLAFNCASVTYGGPLEESSYSVLHGYGEVEGSKKISPGVFVGGSRELMDEVRSNNFDPHEALFVKGHAAWVPEQLNKEIRKGVWYPASVSPNLILHYASTRKDDDFNLWSVILSCMGGKYADIAKSYKGRGDYRIIP